MSTPYRGRRFLAILAVLFSMAVALPRFLTYTPYARFGAELNFDTPGHFGEVRKVVGPPAQGLLEKGDRLLVVDGLPFTRDQFRQLRSSGGLPHGPLPLRIQRGSEVIDLTLPPVQLGVWQRVRLFTYPLIAVIAAPLIAFLLVWRRPDLAAAWGFLGYAALQALFVVWDMFHFPQGATSPLFRGYLVLYGALVWWYPASFLHFMTIFPRPRWRQPGPWRSAWFWLVVVAYAAPLVMWLFGGGPVATQENLFPWFQIIAMPLGTLSLIGHYAWPGAGREARRPQMSERVLALAVAVTLLLAAASWVLFENPRIYVWFSLPFVRFAFASVTVAFLAAPLVIAFLIANDPVFDPRRVVVQSVPYALLSIVLAAVYLGMVVVAQRLFGAATGEEGVMPNLVAALVVAFAFAPFWSRLQRGLNQIFGRDPQALRRSLDRVGQELLGALDRDEVRRAVDEGLRRGLKRHVALEWPEPGAPRLAEGEELPEHAQRAVENLLVQAGIRLENLALQGQRAAAERQAIELREAATRAELRALHAQVQPHFLFNALNALAYLTETDPPAAQRFTERLADMLRYTVEAGDRPAALLSEEIEFVEDYLGVAGERYEIPLEFTYRGPQEMLSLPVPPLLLQPLVENSLKHGCAPGAPALHLELEARREDGTVELTFSDDGTATPNGGPSLGVGLTNLEQRLRRFAGAGASMEAGVRRGENGAAGRGFVVRLRWPSRKEAVA
ncbi:MAG TPA: histidine kinase [Terriglobales bacterium]|nr:histidine kinase [Terriglobales bacterium]